MYLIWGSKQKINKKIHKKNNKFSCFKCSSSSIETTKKKNKETKKKLFVFKITSKKKRMAKKIIDNVNNYTTQAVVGGKESLDIYL